MIRYYFCNKIKIYKIYLCREKFGMRDKGVLLCLGGRKVKMIVVESYVGVGLSFFLYYILRCYQGFKRVYGVVGQILNNLSFK